MGYYLFDHAKNPASQDGTDIPPSSDEQLQTLLEEGTTAQRRAALMQLVERRAEAPLVRCLASHHVVVSQMAAHGLWECWLGEQGLVARAQMDVGVAALGEGDLKAAAEIFEALMADYPSWAEPVNKQATVLYLQGLPDESITLCRVVVAIKPDHFGAWNGLTLCAIQTENWPLALEAVSQSLRLQPCSATNLQLLKLVESRLPAA